MNNRFSKLFLVGVACAALFVRSHADAATYYFDLSSKAIEGGTMALGESADIILRNIGESAPADLRTLLCDKEGVPLAASTNGFSAQGTSARGRMSLATTNLAARFEGMGALKEIPLVFAVWDTARGTLLGSDTVQVRNNPFADSDPSSDTWGSVPSNWGGVDYGSNAVAQLAYAIAQTALDTANATDGRMDALQGEYTAATNELWRAMDSATGGLSGDISALSSSLVSNTEAWVEAMIRFDRRMDELAAGIEPAFTNGTARGLALSPLDQGEWEGSDLSTTPGMYYTTRTNEVGVVVERLLRLVGGLQGVVVDGILSPDGITLGTSQNPLYASNTLTVTNWGQITNRYEELYGFTHGNINRLNTFTNDIWKFAATNRSIANTVRDSLANAINRINTLENATNALHTLSRTNRDNITALSNALYAAGGFSNRIHRLEAATNALNTATGTLNSITRTNQAAISNIWAAIAPLSGMTTSAFTNGTARGLAITPIDEEDYNDFFYGIPGVWATTEYDYRGRPIGHYLHLDGGDSRLDFTPTGVVAAAAISAPGFTLGNTTVTDWDQLTSRVAFTNLGVDVFELGWFVETNSPVITGLVVEEVDEDTYEAIITFTAISTTNRLEWLYPSATPPMDWETWDECSWSYSEGVGTCTVSAPEQGVFYRIVYPDGYSDPGETNFYLVASVPIYIAERTEENRLATMADVAAAVAKVASSSSSKAGTVSRRAYKDAYNVAPTNLAWNLDQYGTPYFADLSIGGWEDTTVEITDFEVVTNTVIETNGVDIVTNTVVVTNILDATTNTVTQTGTLSLNGVGITDWSDIASGSGFPLTNNADFAGFAASNVGSIQFSGATNELAVGEGRLLFGGRPIDANLEAGHGISLTENTNTGAKVVAVTRNIDFDNVTVHGDLTVEGTEYHNTIRRYYTNVYVGVSTTRVAEVIYTTNYSWEVHTVIDRSTNHVDEVINVGGDVDHSRAASVKEPSFTIDNSDTNNPVLTGTGRWDLSGTGLDVGTNLDSKISSGAVSAVQSANLSSLTLGGDTITAWPTSSVASAWTTIYDDTGATNTPVGAEPLKITASTNHAGVLWMGETNGIKVLSIGIMAAGGGGGGSGVWTPTNRVVTSASDTVLTTDYLIWMDPSTAQTNQTLVLPVMGNDQSIIVRQLGDLYGTSITYGTNSFYLSGNGEWVGFDYLVGHGWYWRQ